MDVRSADATQRLALFNDDTPLIESEEDDFGYGTYSRAKALTEIALKRPEVFYGEQEDIVSH